MSSAYATICDELSRTPRVWTVTGAAGFIGSHLVEKLLLLGQRVVGLDNFATGSRENLGHVLRNVGTSAWARFDLIEGDVNDPNACRLAMKEADYVLHQAALGSVQRSINQPLRTNAANVDGFLNVLVTADRQKVERVVYASSSSVYGDWQDAVRVEPTTGSPLSPYAASKRAAELYAAAFAKVHGLPVVGLRYFNVFGPRQNADGPYAAVIPKWMKALTNGDACTINHDGNIRRDFCYVKDVAQANILAATSNASEGVYNVGSGDSMSLDTLHCVLTAHLQRARPDLAARTPETPLYGPPRPNDVRSSRACIDKIVGELGYRPSLPTYQALEETFIYWLARSTVAPDDSRP